MSLERDDMFFRQFSDWYIGRTVYRIIEGKLQELVIEKVTVTNRSVYINDNIDINEETVYVDKEEAEESYRLYKHLE
ncbi:hypothetical protein [Blautia fusiformis]|jgi:hypothetical protein|uniref:Uncharacterized protein n=1 Tax=Blautia fusiformis TaxID=2881264 RepID=A0AAW4WB03_9FIRM|nr:hypothetical protein [Blautia fusiformis]MCC2228518.1 hypothetical protein [Blautia fusiformis]DAI48197.1 MAG TPA: hypothetical protein [Caudoviricetes sp.]DAR56916.1 MAG TPA: hypothetical protein [Caudoviricetes sp.]DAX50886.1 MAG TPA: hypothetical protein [Bacteriophage sp.]